MIPLDPKTKKNHQSISGCGPRCPICKKPKKQFIRNSDASTEFAFKAAPFLNPRPKTPFSGTVHIVYRIYTQTRRRVDDLNLYANLDDILVKEGVLRDDNRNIIRCRDRSRVFYDKDNPRAEIYIYQYEEKEDAYATVWNEDVHGGQVSGAE